MDAADAASEPSPARLLRLTAAGAGVDAREAVELAGVWERPPGAPARPRVLLNMISTVDGRATIDGRSAPLGSSADRALFHALREACDAVLVGAGTARSERYGRIIRDPAQRRLRRERGLEEEALACIVSSRLALEGVPLLSQPGARVAILTPSEGTVAAAADIAYVRAGAGGTLDLAAALAQLSADHGVRVLLCEGGPHLAAQLLAGGLLDELFLSLSPLLAAGEAASGQALRILAGPGLDPPVALELREALQSSSQLFLHYGVSARE